MGDPYMTSTRNFGPSRPPKAKPEPWRVERNINDYGIVRGNQQIAGYIVSKKDAILMAAAPELLKALKDLRKNVDADMSGYWTESTSNFMQQAEAVIAKVEG